MRVAAALRLAVKKKRIAVCTAGAPVQRLVRTRRGGEDRRTPDDAVILKLITSAPPGALRQRKPSPHTE